jgi:hypothetical protein
MRFNFRECAVEGIHTDCMLMYIACVLNVYIACVLNVSHVLYCTHA